MIVPGAIGAPTPKSEARRAGLTSQQTSVPGSFCSLGGPGHVLHFGGEDTETFVGTASAVPGPITAEQSTANQSNAVESRAAQYKATHS